MNFLKSVTVDDHIYCGQQIKNQISDQLNLDEKDFYLVQNGKKVQNDTVLVPGTVVHVALRLCGGKGGFGSMLRAIGAQIEKTTNREACRDLSGRRLRDINEEKRLKNWIASQADREQEALDRKQKKIERLSYQPKHKFDDAEYEKSRSELQEKVSDAVDEGFKMAAAATTAAASTAGNTNVVLKRKADSKKMAAKNKKKKLWIDADLSCSEDSSDCGSDVEDSIQKKQSVQRPRTACATVTSGAH